MDKPSVGRIVHFYNSALATGDIPQAGAAAPGYNGQGAGPYPAIVTQTFPDADGNTIYINLKVLPPFAPPFDEGSVSERVSDDEVGRFWTWPPRN